MTNRGGPLVTLIRPFRMGLGERLGNGRQWSPWVHLDDTTSALTFMAQTESIDGAVNVVSPGVVRNSEMTKAIGKAVGMPAWGWACRGGQDDAWRIYSRAWNRERSGGA